MISKLKLHTPKFVKNHFRGEFLIDSYKLELLNIMYVTLNMFTNNEVLPFDIFILQIINIKYRYYRVHDSKKKLSRCKKKIWEVVRQDFFAINRIREMP